MSETREDYSQHPGLAWLRDSEGGRAWLAAVPRVVRECAQRWDLSVGQPFPYAYTAVTLPARMPDGTDAVLKVMYPHRESEHEAAALDVWNGDGAVRLLAHDPIRHALLLERCIPGSPLSQHDATAAIDVFVGLLPRLWKPVGSSFRPLADEAAWWAEGMPAQWDQAGRPFEKTLLDAALDALRTLPDTQGQRVLLHQDLHGENVLRATREPWLAIDPKPLQGEREFGLAPIIRAFEFGHGRRNVAYRLDRLTAELGLDRTRARLWCLAQTIAWCFGSDYLDQHVETARWLLEI